MAASKGGRKEHIVIDKRGHLKKGNLRTLRDYHPGQHRCRGHGLVGSTCLGLVMAIRFSGSDCFPCPYSTGLALLTGESVVDRENTKSCNNPAPGTPSTRTSSELVS
jgi:hypothetical protein